MDRPDGPVPADRRDGTEGSTGAAEPDEPGESGGTDEDADPDRSALHVASEGESWRFSLDDLDEESDRKPLTPGEPRPEHVAFVLLGAAVTLFVASRFVV